MLLVSDLLPALGGSRAGHELIQEFINDGLADLTHYNRDGVWGTLHENFMEEYVWPEAKWRRVRASFKPGVSGVLRKVCSFSNLGESLSRSSSKRGGDTRRKLLNEHGSSARSSTISLSYTPSWGLREIQSRTQYLLPLLLLLSFSIRLWASRYKFISWYWCLMTARGLVLHGWVQIHLCTTGVEVDDGQRCDHEGSWIWTDEVLQSRPLL